MFCFSLGIQNGLPPAVKTVAGSLKVFRNPFKFTSERRHKSIGILVSVEIREPVG